MSETTEKKKGRKTNAGSYYVSTVPDERGFETCVFEQQPTDPRQIPAWTRRNFYGLAKRQSDDEPQSIQVHDAWVDFLKNGGLPRDIPRYLLPGP